MLFLSNFSSLPFYPLLYCKFFLKAKAQFSSIAQKWRFFRFNAKKNKKILPFFTRTECAIIYGQSSIIDSSSINFYTDDGIGGIPCTQKRAEDYPLALHKSCAYTFSISARMIWLTIFGFALPWDSFITWPTRKPSARSLPFL